METWIMSIQESLDKGQPLFIEASEGISLMEGSEDESDHDDGNQTITMRKVMMKTISG